MKIRLVFSIPGKPRGRGRIGRFFSTANEMLLCELDGYAPAAGAVRAKPTLTLAEFDTRFREFLLDIYHRRENAETKLPPVERWEQPGDQTICGAQVGRTLAPAIEDQQLMPHQHGLGDNGTKSARPCQSRHRHKQMNGWIRKSRITAIISTRANRQIFGQFGNSPCTG